MQKEEEQQREYEEFLEISRLQSHVLIKLAFSVCSQRLSRVVKSSERPVSSLRFVDASCSDSEAEALLSILDCSHEFMNSLELVNGCVVFVRVYRIREQLCR